MKRVTAGLVWVVCGVGLLAQGTVEFNNSPSALGGIGAPILMKRHEPGGYKHGSSTLFTVATSSGGIPPTLPSKLVGLTSFSLIPEPSIYAMIVLGMAVLIACGRRLKKLTTTHKPIRSPI